MIFAAAATLLGAAAQSATGFGFALVAGPVLFAVVEPYEAVTLLALLGVVLSGLVMTDAGLAAVRWRAIGLMLATALPGLGLGLLAIELLPKPALQLGVGVAVMAAALLQLRRRAEAEAAPAPEPDAPPGRSASVPFGPAALAGVTSGALTTSIGVSGPPLVLWLEELGLSPIELRASLSAGFLGLNVAAGAVLLAAGGARAAPDAGLVLPLLGVVVAGHLAGAAAFRRIDAGLFRRVILGLVMAAGAASAVAGVIGLL